MKCPNCFSPMKKMLLDDRIPGHVCTSCEGVWISSVEYADWMDAQKGTDSPDASFSEETALPEVAIRKPLLCPDCGRIIKRYKIWPNVEFYLDRCGGCNGIWFDKNEWDVLADYELTKHLNMLFSDEWQKSLRKEEMAGRLTAMYSDRFGEVDYSKLKEIREWIYSNESRDQLIAYLMDKDPYES